MLLKENRDLKIRINSMFAMPGQLTRKIINILVESALSFRMERYPLDVDDVAKYLKENPKESVADLKMFTILFLDENQHKKVCDELDRVHTNLPSILKKIDNPRSCGRGV